MNEVINPKIAAIVEIKPGKFKVTLPEEVYPPEEGIVYGRNVRPGRY